ncbi:MAG: hypothetical protein KAI24_00450 [Planctomycetes bacterium]|nr:hypothetical protein [Planctomycetota bacterium]
MFVDAVWANVLLFAVGQVFAWLYMRGGRFWLGAGATLALWVAIDWWLISRFLLDATAAEQRAPVLLLQVTAIAIGTAFVWSRIRSLRGRSTRGERHRSAVACALSGDHAGAAARYRELVWSDGQDAAAWIGLGDAMRRGGHARRARSAYARAAAVDVTRAFADLLAHRMKQLLRAESAAGQPGNGPSQRGGAEQQVATGADAADPAIGRRRRGAKARTAS